MLVDGFASIREVSLVGAPKTGLRFNQIDSRRRVVEGTVYKVLHVDSDNDYVLDEQALVTAEDLWRKGGSPIWINHNRVAPRYRVLKSEVKGGAWDIAVEVDDQLTWDQVVRGELLGFSLAGGAQRSLHKIRGFSEYESALLVQVRKDLDAIAASVAAWN